MKQPLVSICCITYNHSKYIRECLEGFLLQETTFNFEILIYDDASNDGTVEIIREYELKYPSIVFPIYQSQNQYSLGKRGMNYIYNFPRVRGKYIALCEGDDYWTAANKLQKQIEYLDSNSNFVGSFHSCSIEDSKKRKLKNYYPIPKSNTLKLKQMLWRHYIPTASLVFRINSLHNIQINRLILSGDRFLEISLAMNGDFYFFEEEMAVHIKHENGITNSTLHKNLEKVLLSELHLYKQLKMIAIQTGKISKIYNPKIATISMARAIYFAKKFKLKEMLKEFFRSVFHISLSPWEFTTQKIFKWLN